MKVALFTLVMTAGITGCDSGVFDNSIEKAVRAELKDPDSAQFKEQIILKTRACISVNSKNSFGGYTGPQTAHLKNLGNDFWALETIGKEPCYRSVLERKLEIDKENDEAFKAIIDKLKAKKLIDESVQDVMSIKDQKCRLLALNQRAYIKLASEAKDQARKEYYQAEARNELAVIDTGSCHLK